MLANCSAAIEGVYLNPRDVFGPTDTSLIHNLLIMRERPIRSNKRPEGTSGISVDSGYEFKSPPSTATSANSISKVSEYGSSNSSLLCRVDKVPFQTQKAQLLTKGREKPPFSSDFEEARHLKSSPISPLKPTKPTQELEISNTLSSLKLTASTPSFEPAYQQSLYSSQPFSTINFHRREFYTDSNSSLQSIDYSAGDDFYPREEACTIPYQDSSSSIECFSSEFREKGFHHSQSYSPIKTSQISTFNQESETFYNKGPNFSQQSKQCNYKDNYYLHEETSLVHHPNTSSLFQSSELKDKAHHHSQSYAPLKTSQSYSSNIYPSVSAEYNRVPSFMPENKKEISQGYSSSSYSSASAEYNRIPSFLPENKKEISQGYSTSSYSSASAEYNRIPTFLPENKKEFNQGFSSNYPSAYAEYNRIPTFLPENKKEITQGYVSNIHSSSSAEYHRVPTFLPENKREINQGFGSNMHPSAYAEYNRIPSFMPESEKEITRGYVSNIHSSASAEYGRILPENKKEINQGIVSNINPSVSAEYKSIPTFLPDNKQESYIQQHSNAPKDSKRVKGYGNGIQPNIEPTDMSEHFNNPSEALDTPILSPEEVKQIPAIIKTKNGSKKVQQNIGSSTPEEISKFVYIIKPYIAELMCDTYANYMCQTLFQNCNSSQRLILIEAMQNQLVDIATSERGTHSLQSLIALASLPREESIYLKHLAPKAVQLSMHIYGSHVIQRLLVSMKNKEVITDKLLGNVKFLAKNKLGLCVIKKCMYDSRVRNEILEDLVVLMQDPYGNYAIQHLLEVWGQQSYAGLISYIRGNVAQLCIQKFSSNVMERFMREKRLRDEMIGELLHEDKIQLLLNCPYGCYVIKTAAELAEPKLKERLRNLILKVRQLLYVKKLAPRWEEILTILNY